MGDGPGYDNAYSEARERARTEKERCERRLKILYEMNSTVGFGRDNDVANRMVRERLEEATLLLETMVRL